MNNTSGPIPPETAWERIETVLGAVERTNADNADNADNAERVPRRDAAGRVLAEALLATTHLPATDVSAMDGYAVAGAVRSGQTLPVAGTIAAGDAPGFDLQDGQAVRIMTGAPTPAAAWTVVPVEDTDGGEREVTFHQEPAESAHIRRQAEVLRAGQQLLSAGHRLGPGSLSLLAAHGYTEVATFRPPRVSTLSTGDEVVPPEAEPRPGQLRDSNTDFLLTAGRRLGLSFEPLGIAADTEDDLRHHLRRALDYDVALVTGGVSMGAFDLVEPVLDELNCEVLLDAVAMQPGKPLVVAKHPGGWIFGLPGNPASVMVGYWLFVRPLLRTLLGIPDHFWKGALQGRLTAPLPGAKWRDRFLPAEVESSPDGTLLVTPRPPKGSHDVAAYALGDALVRIRPEAAPADVGAACEVLALAEWP